MPSSIGGHDGVTTKCSDVVNGEMTQIDVSVASGSKEPAISNGFWLADGARPPNAATAPGSACSTPA